MTYVFFKYFSLFKYRYFSKNHSFDFLIDIHSKKIFTYLHYENKQIVSLILYFLPTYKSSEILSFFDKDTQDDILLRISSFQDIDVHFISLISEHLKEVFSNYEKNMILLNGNSKSNSISNFSKKN